MKNNINTSLRLELKSTLNKEGARYLVVTENHIGKKMVITTSVFKDTRPVLTRREPMNSFGDLLDAAALKVILSKQHETVLGEIVGSYVSESFNSSKSLIEWVREHLRKQNKKKAYEILKDSLEFYHDDPYVLTYYGSMSSMFAGNHKQGIMACNKAIELAKEKMPDAGDDIMPFFYLNLARSCMAGGDRKGAIDALFEGTSYDRKGGLIHRELVKIGVRRKPLLPFLTRGHIINKYIGILLYRKLGLSGKDRMELKTIG